MRKKICVAKFSNESNGLLEMINDFEVAVLRTWLDENEIGTMVYTDKELPSMVDLAEDMESISDSWFVLLTNDRNKEYSHSLKKNLLEIDEDMEVLLLERKFEDGKYYYDKAELLQFLKQLEPSFNLDKSLGDLYQKQKFIKNIEDYKIPLVNYFDNGSVRECGHVIADFNTYKTDLKDKKIVVLDGIPLNKVSYSDELFFFI